MQLFALAVVVTSLGHHCVRGMVGLYDANAADIRAVPDQFVAIGREACDCEALRVEIAELAQGQFGAMSAVSARKIRLERTCLVKFQGGPESAAYVGGLPCVESVEPDALLKAQTRPPASWGLDRIDQDSAILDNAAFDPAFDGSGATIYVLDTGINYEHVEFRGRVKHYSVVAESPEEDNQGHGSHCAGTAAGSTYGVARGAQVWGIKVLNYQGSGSVSDIAEGIEKAIELQGGRPGGVLSMSLGGGFSAALNRAAEAANEAGLIVVVAAGNSNMDACDASPASAGGNGRNGGVIAVGATQILESGASFRDVRASFSNYGKCVDLWAPGVDIVSAWKHSSTASNSLSGTSMATPHVAGAAAILLEKHGLDKGAAIAELFALATPSVTTGSGAPDPKVVRNRFLHVSPYTGPPTLPTPQPTMPPTPATPGLYIGADMFPFAPSKFGPGLDEWPGHRVHGPAHVIKDQPQLCGTTTAENVVGKIAVVERGGCKFHEKVVRAQEAGAIGVVIGQTRRESLFSPTWNGVDEARVPSCMVDFDGLEALRASTPGQVVTFGQPLPDGDSAKEEETEEERRARRDARRARRRARRRRNKENRRGLRSASHET